MFIREWKCIEAGDIQELRAIFDLRRLLKRRREDK